MFEKTKINKKRPGLAHFFKKSSTDHLMELFQFQMESLTAIVRTITHKKTNLGTAWLAMLKKEI